MHDKWEYKILYCGAERWTDTGLPPDLNERFEELGAAGWEVAAMVSIERPSLMPWGGSKTAGVLVTFKRRITS